MHVKTHRDNAPIRPVINHTQAPSHKLARHFNRKLRYLLPLPNTYNVKNSQEIAEGIINIRINEHMKLITLDKKDPYVNVPTQGVLQAAKFWLQKSSNNVGMNKQILTLLKTVMEQNYFQYNNQFYKPDKGIAMGSPISGTIAEVYYNR